MRWIPGLKGISRNNRPTSRRMNQHVQTVLVTGEMSLLFWKKFSPNAGWWANTFCSDILFQKKKKKKPGWNNWPVESCKFWSSDPTRQCWDFFKPSFWEKNYHNGAWPVFKVQAEFFVEFRACAFPSHVHRLRLLNVFSISGWHVTAVGWLHCACFLSDIGWTLWDRFSVNKEKCNFSFS